MIVRILALVVLAWAFGFILFVVTLPQSTGAAPTDAIVVLTGAPGRIERGIALLRQRRARRLLISGVDRTVRPHELALSTRTPAAVFDCCIDLGRESVDTRSNAEETAGWVRKHRYRTVRLVTTDWHMRRARFELARLLPDTVVIVEDAVRSEPGLTALLKEYDKYLLRRLAVPLGV